jgi:glycosyltransferase involved in cell wall biosynthesis
MIRSKPIFLYHLEEAFFTESNPLVRQRIARVLASKTEYYALKLKSNDAQHYESILGEIIKTNIIGELISFLNVNKDPDLEGTLLNVLKQYVIFESDADRELRTFLSPHLVEKLHKTVLEETTSTKVHTRDMRLIRAIVILSTFMILVLPLTFMMRHLFLLKSVTLFEFIKSYVLRAGYLFAAYSMTLNLTYLCLLILSYLNVRKQARLWRIKTRTMLFRKAMCPSISIIAPAYNEEKSIIASAKSLLNLNYPDYELIVVNDGSKDDTLYELIQGFQLERVNYDFVESIPTAKVRGIYLNPSYPKLIVVDKSNGGKADALNVGINLSRKNYFCGIDADSLLEPDALLKLTSMTLDEDVETPALGGNIFPINGCTVDKGHITHIAIPQNVLARMQTIEYIRSFMAGRLGWQQINSLLIISGAFGLFSKERVIEVGGYLTQRGIHRKDTVGEDMELVVRIVRHMYDIRKPHKIQYAFNANCWTEVPEDLRRFKKFKEPAVQMA